MKKTLAVLAVILLTACGHVSMDSEMVGQAKKVSPQTPLVCPNYTAFDMSLGVVRNGTGSMSTQDAWFVVRDTQDLDKIKQAVETGSLVKVRYNTLRGFSSFCVEDYEMTSFEIIQ